MSQQQSPWLEAAYGWSYGENGWNTGMDSNLLKFSVMFDRNVDSIVSSLPSAVNGEVHYNTSDNRLYFAVNTTYFSTPVPKWFKILDRGTGETWQFNGTSLEQVATADELNTRLEAVELTLSTLGTAAFEDVSAFATQAELDIVEAQAQSYTDTFRTDLADDADDLKGAALVGYSGRTVADFLGELAITPAAYGAVADGVTDDYAAIVAAKAAASAVGLPLRFTKIGLGHYFIADNELVFSEGGLVVECEAGVEIRGNGGADGGYVVSFALQGGTAQPDGVHPTNQRVRGLRVRTVAPFSVAAGRAAIRVCGSYGLYEDCSAVNSADNGGGGMLWEADSTGTGPYYNTFIDCNLQGAQNGLATGVGLRPGQKVGTIASRFPNTNTWIGGRVGGYGVNYQLAGQGNRFIGTASENSPTFGTAFEWISPAANTNLDNILYSPYIENAATAYLVGTQSSSPTVLGHTFTGVTTVVSDPSNRLTIFGQDGVRAVRLAKAPNANAPRSGIYLGNTLNADLETLDWYEEGSWTPTLAGATTPGDYTLTPSRAHFTRIGNKVSVSTSFTVTINSAGTGNARFGGLPYPKGANRGLGGTVETTNCTFAAGTISIRAAPFTSGSDSSLMIRGVRSGTSPLSLLVTDIANDATITFDINYTV